MPTPHACRVDCTPVVTVHSVTGHTSPPGERPPVAPVLRVGGSPPVGRAHATHVRRLARGGEGMNRWVARIGHAACCLAALAAGYYGVILIHHVTITSPAW